MPGRKTAKVVVPAWAGNRDADKTFLITEMSAAAAEKWAARAFLALTRTGGAQIPLEARELGMVGVAIVGLNMFLKGGVEFRDLEPLMDEMFTCVRMIRDPRAVDQATGGPVATEIVSDDDVEEVQTRAWLRSEVLKLHTGFSIADGLSWLISEVASSRASQSPPTSQG
jgi:hypothetical protein